MGIIKNFIDELAKHKMLVYFMTFWGAWLFLWTVYGFIEWGFNTDLLGIIDLLFHLSELFAGLLLIILGIKLMNTTILEGIKNDQLLIYFLMLWAASFFFWGLYTIIDYGPVMFEYGEYLIAFLSGLAGLFAGVTLGLFSWKLLNEPEQNTT